MAKRDPKLARAGVSGYNKPKRTPNHKTKSHVVVAKSGGQTKTIRFGQQGVKGAPRSPTRLTGGSNPCPRTHSTHTTSIGCYNRIRRAYRAF
jgi:hypothetical protein